MRNLSIFMCLFFMASIQADNHTKAEQEVAKAFAEYFDARSNQDWDTVAAMESASGTFNTNSDGSFHKGLAKTTAAQWGASGQLGSLNTYYPEFSQIADGVVYVRFYYEGVAQNGSISSDYRTRVSQNWVKEEGKWVVKTSHYSPAQFGGVHITVATDFDN